MAGNETKDIVEGTVKAALEATPVYQDALQPAAKELGKGLLTVAKLVNVALAPIKGLVWSYEKVEDYLNAKLGDKLCDVPQDQIETPLPIVAVPAIQALMLTGGEPTLSELYANLLATAMDSSTAGDALPSFVEIIKQMSSDEAKIFSMFEHRSAFHCIGVSALVRVEDRLVRQIMILHFSLLGEEASCTYPDKITAYVDNLERLGLVKVDLDIRLEDGDKYELLRNHVDIQGIVKRIENVSDATVEIKEGEIRISTLGKHFFNACVASKTSEGPKRINLVPQKIYSSEELENFGP